MTVKDLITMMIIVSDNTATEVLYRMVGGPEAVNARMDALGLTQDARDERAVAVVRGAARRGVDRSSSTATASIRSACRRRARWDGCSR